MRHKIKRIECQPREKGRNFCFAKEFGQELQSALYWGYSTFFK